MLGLGEVGLGRLSCFGGLGREALACFRAYKTKREAQGACPPIAGGLGCEPLGWLWRTRYVKRKRLALGHGA